MTKHNDDESEGNARDADSKPDVEGCIWVTEFNDDTLREFYAKFLELENNPRVSIVPIYISSYGGETDVLSAMRDIIKSSSKPVATIALGKAMSSGVALLASGTKGLRFCAPNTDMMIHEMTAGAHGKSAEINAAALDIKRSNEKFLSNLALDMGSFYKKLMAEIDRRRNADWYISAEEARSLGIVDHIEIPRTIFKPSMMTLAVLPPAPARINVDMGQEGESSPQSDRPRRKRARK